ncbi:hypothetical protein [Rhizobium paknamense]|uniref:GtrA family protein n=1 Tax=Rhizobium paknamense TaxID=1206817 RepID=A0ABU0IDM7_9HYPH|nr:hypothetical protein [Rhizobium paknamense]MDQ0455540.1 hypothetical protein [Rhizobium paknamense]
MANSALSPTPFFRMLLRILAYGAGTIAFVSVMTLPFARDYVGADNDDAMRLVEVRDYLAGQGWFDLMQYRLGLPPGVLMHWSRLIDWPIATLIRSFSLFLPAQGTEAAALAVWPLLLTLPVLAALGHAGERLGGRVASHVMLLMGALYLISSNRFLPGAIDHHNVQIGLVAIMAAVLVTRANWRGFGLAGLAAATALAIGAETTPLMAVVCAAVALCWALEGQAFRSRAIAYSLSFSLGVTLFFIGTVPPARYGVVTCDNLSFGFYALATLGGGLLFVASLLGSALSRLWRFACLLLIAAITGVAATLIAPQCLGNPLAELDPMLVTLWLNKVGEARSVLAVARTEPEALGAFYASGLFGLLVCAARLMKRDRVRMHAIMGALLFASFGVALIQVRGTMFSNLLTILPLSLLIVDLRAAHRQAPQKIGRALTYAAAALAAPSAAWAMAGTLWVNGLPKASDFGQAKQAVATGESCFDARALKPLADLPPTTVVSAADGGSWILRFTPHRVLAAPYHRNQGGMLTELHIGLSTPADAEAFLRGAHAGILAFCPGNVQTQDLIALKPDGLYARLAAGEVPPYLTPLPSAGGLKLFAVTGKP